jgi:hypothetical protein
LQECKERKRLDDYSWANGLPLLFRYSRPSNLPESTAALEAMRDNSRSQFKPDQESTNGHQTIFDCNYAQPGVACQENFGSKQSLISTYDHANRVGGAQNEEWEEDGGTMPPPISKDFIFMIGDGDPQLQGSRLKCDFPERYEKIVNIPGQFHYMMDDFKANNLLFEEVLNSLLGPIFGGNLKRMGINFTKFSDPIVPEKQLSSLLLAIHVHIIQSMVSSGKSSFSVVDMHDNVKEISEKRPLAMLMFTLLLYYNITFMHRKTTRDNNVDGFLPAVCLSISKYCITHSTSYL